MLLIHQPQLFMAVVAVLWRNLQSQNWAVFEGKQFEVPYLMRQCHQQYQEWVTLPVDYVLQSSIPLAHSLGGVNPDSIVCMWDVATKSASLSAYGMVIRSQDGEILLAKGVRFVEIDDLMVVELLVLRAAIL
ncbi:unnamed protein product [Linum trigynum]|uniref:Uncharacterized protein n=1 Tax=Linum trigynum TaxID=586398 RepID=A0AAV2FRI2_9ROSI